MAAYEAGVAIYAGTDAGGVLPHGLIAGEVRELAGYGLTPERRPRRRLLAGARVARARRPRSPRAPRPTSSSTTATRSRTSRCWPSPKRIVLRGRVVG